MPLEKMKIDALANLIGDERLSDILNDYSCNDKDVESYLKETALMHSRNDVSKTYLFFDGKTLVGYFTLGVKCLSIRDTKLSDKLRKKLNPSNGIAQAYLLGQLSRSDASKKGTGLILLKEAINIFNKLRSEVGCRIIRLDCNDELIDYYEEHGFIKIGRNNSDDLNQMEYVLS